MASLKTIAQNKKARHDYFIEETYEAGIELFGTEVKSIRQGRVNLKDSWCSIDKGEIFVNGMHISPYEQGNIFNRDPMRVRKLLMHKKEINRLFGVVKQMGYSLIPISLYFKPRQGAGRSLQGQKALRQARGHGKTRRQARHGARHQGTKQVSSIHDS